MTLVCVRILPGAWNAHDDDDDVPGPERAGDSPGGFEGHGEFPQAALDDYCDKKGIPYIDARDIKKVW